MAVWTVKVRGEFVGTVDALTARDARTAAMSDFDVDDHRDIELSCDNPVQSGLDRTTSGAIGHP